MSTLTITTDQHPPLPGGRPRPILAGDLRALATPWLARFTGQELFEIDGRAGEAVIYGLIFEWRGYAGVYEPDADQVYSYTMVNLAIDWVPLGVWLARGALEVISRHVPDEAATFAILSPPRDAFDHVQPLTRLTLARMENPSDCVPRPARP